MTFEQLGVTAGEMYLPAKDFEKWSVVACDQYTSEPEYWEQTQKITAGFPSALRLMLPELYLSSPDADERIAGIKRTMREYVDGGVLVKLPRGAIFTQRSVSGGVRRGALFALDLERYDYSVGSKSLIRATEGTIKERIPPRLRVREGAALEMPHIMVLIDDKTDSFLSAVQRAAKKPLYDFELMQSGGRIKGAFAPESELEPARAALETLYLSAKKTQGDQPLLFAVGDGNHSLATAKAAWEKLKQNGAAPDHPARWALAEIVNIHDPALVFEPIHRILFNAGEGALLQLAALMRWSCGSEELCDERYSPKDVKTHEIVCVTRLGGRVLTAFTPQKELEVSTLQRALDEYLRANPQCSVDYVHGEASVRAIVARDQTAIGFLLPTLSKDSFFPAVIAQGALERKTFSMGHANEKRYYLETRLIQN